MQNAAAIVLEESASSSDPSPPRTPSPPSPPPPLNEPRPLLIRLKPSSEAHARLITFPHAGGWTSAYQEWQIPNSLELWCIQLPGRGPRFLEPAYTSLERLCADVIDALQPTIDAGIPFAFFGHSFGSLVALEVSRGLGARELTTPLALFVAAHALPNEPLSAAEATLSQSTTNEVRARGAEPSIDVSLTATDWPAVQAICSCGRALRDAAPLLRHPWPRGGLGGGVCVQEWRDPCCGPAAPAAA